MFKLNNKQGTVVAGMAVSTGRIRINRVGNSGGSGSGSNAGISYLFRVLRPRYAMDKEPTVILDEFMGSTDLKRFKDSVTEVELPMILSI